MALLLPPEVYPWIGKLIAWDIENGFILVVAILLYLGSKFLRVINLVSRGPGKKSQAKRELSQTPKRERYRS